MPIGRVPDSIDRGHRQIEGPPNSFFFVFLLNNSVAANYFLGWCLSDRIIKKIHFCIFEKISYAIEYPLLYILISLMSQKINSGNVSPVGALVVR